MPANLSSSIERGTLTGHCTKTNTILWGCGFLNKPRTVAKNHYLGVSKEKALNDLIQPLFKSTMYFSSFRVSRDNEQTVVARTS